MSQPTSSERSRRRYRWIIRVLAVAGALRVLVFAAAFPPFVFIDEALHFENVIKYAKVGLPQRHDDAYDTDAVRTFATYGMHEPGTRADLTPQQRRQAVEAKVALYATGHNCETFSPPLYYATAAAWHRLGRALGLRDPALIYWLRFLGAILYGVTIWLACRLCLKFHRERPELAVAAGLVLVAIPQDILYTINCDAGSPLAVAAALYLLVTWLESPPSPQPPQPRRWRSILLAAAAGLAVAAALLVKYSNAGVIAATVVAMVIRLRRRRTGVAEVATLLLCAAVPVGAWMLRCHLLLGDWTAARHPGEMLGWTRLTWSQSLEHPVFGPLGFLEFSARLWVTFWRGELVWGDRVQRVDWVDGFYLAVTVLALLGTVGWLLRPSPRARQERPLALIYLVTIVGSVLFLALVSARFDYGRCFFPSRGFPYFGAGRLLSGSLAPFAILLAGALQELLGSARTRYATVVACAVIAAVCLASEVYACAWQTERSVFASPINFYHVCAPGR